MVMHHHLLLALFVSGFVSIQGCGFEAPLSASEEQNLEGADDVALPTSIEGLPNFRDIGGKSTTDGRRVKRGVLFRSEQLATVKSTAILQSMRIERIVDFRGSPEKTEQPDPAINGISRLELPVFDEAHPHDDIGAQLSAKIFGTLAQAKEANDPALVEAALADLDAWAATLTDRMLTSYVQFVTEPIATKQFAAFAAAAADGKRSLFHCVSGKDRTGFAAAIVLRGVGVSFRDIMADYLQSNRGLERDIQGKLAAIGNIWPDNQPGHLGASSLRPILGVDAAYLTASFARIQQDYGAGYPPRTGEVVSDQAIANFFASVFGPGVQAALRKALLE